MQTTDNSFLCDVVRWRAYGSRMLVLLGAVAATGWSTPPVLAAGLSIADQDGVTTIRQGDRLLLEYQSKPHPYKAYVSRFFTPKGVQILRDSPHDHVHHHALMYAIGIDGVDFWGEFADAKPGTQNVLSTSTTAQLTNDRGQAAIRQTIDWVDAGKQSLAREQRALTLHIGVVPNVSLLSWQCRLAAASDRTAASLWGRHYFGLGMRMVTSMDEGGKFFNATGKAGTSVRGSEQLVRANWCAYTAKVGDKPVTVAMFDAPKNPRHPATWFTMTDPFAYLSATMALEKEPLEIRVDKPLEARYGIALWDGEVSAEAVERVYRAWLELP
jgi:hypothetical protein